MHTTTIHSETRRTNLLTLQGELAAGRSWLTARPVELALEVSTDCPFHCIHCPRTYADPEEHPRAHMHPNIVERLEPFMDTLARLMIVGDGEPMSSPYFREIIDLCLASGALVSFSTNGDRMDIDMSRRMVEGGLAHVQFSIDSASSEIYAQIRKGSRLKRVLDNMRNLAKLRERSRVRTPHIVMASVLMRRNADEAADLVGIASRNGADQVILNPLAVPPVHPQTREFYRLEALPLDRLREAVEQAKARGSELGIEVLSPAVDDLTRRGEDGERAWMSTFTPTPTCAVYPRYQRAAQERNMKKEKAPSVGDEQIAASEPPPPRCTQPWTTMHIRWNGDLSPCLLNHEPEERLTPFSDPWEAWNGPAFRAARRKLALGEAPKRCSSCREGGSGRDIVEECGQVVMPMDPLPEVKPETEMELRGEGLILALGFSAQGTSLGLAGKECPLYFRTMESIMGMAPCRFISRHAPASASGELYMEDEIFREIVHTAIGEAGVNAPDRIRWIVYNPHPSIGTDLPEGRNPVLEELFPKAEPLVVEAHLGRMALAYLTSPFDAAALLVMDTAGNGGPGDLILGRAEGMRLETPLDPPLLRHPSRMLKGVRGFLGLDAWEEARVIDLGAEGSSKLDETFIKEIEPDEEAGFRFREGGFLAGLSREGTDQDPAAILEEKFGPRRHPGEAFDAIHMDVAHAVRGCMDEILLHLARKLREIADCDVLCIGGGPWFHQALLNRIMDETSFTRLHAPPLETGLGMGAGSALYAAHVRRGLERPSHLHLRSAFSMEGKPSPAPEDVCRFTRAAIATLRQQHDKMARTLADPSSPPRTAPSSAAELLARQNKRLWKELDFVSAEHARLLAFLEETSGISGLLKRIAKRITSKRKS